MTRWDEGPVLCFTSDVEWSSEEALRETQALFEAHGVRPTYFFTHPTAFLNGCLKEGRIEAGVHPNFLPDSSHGRSVAEVIDYCLNLVPGVECFRSHRFYDVTDVTHGFYARGLRYDANVCTLLQKGIRPFVHESGLLRFPTFFEDGTYLFHKLPLQGAAPVRALFEGPGLRILSVHPMHMVMNSPDLGYARRVKDGLSREAWNRLAGGDLARHRHPGRGIRDFFEEVLAEASRLRLPVLTLKQLYQEARPAAHDARG